MPLIRKWQRLGFKEQLAVLCSVLLLICGALIISLIAVVASRGASSEAQKTADCINKVLKDRNGPAAQDITAHIKFAQADLRFSDALFAVLTLPSGSQPQREAYDRFVVVARLKKAADHAYVEMLLADQTERNDNPLGKC